MSFAHKISATIGKDGNLVLKNLPFDEGTRIDIFISTPDAKTGIERLIENDHVWSEEDIEAVQRGREIINQRIFSSPALPSGMGFPFARLTGSISTRWMTSN